MTKVSNLQNDLYNTRGIESNDINFIYDSWCESYRASLYVREVPKEIYFKGQRELINKIASKSSVLLAVNKEDPNHIIAYLVFHKVKEINILHYIYVKYPFRKMGIAKRLLTDVGAFESVTIATHANSWLLKKKEAYNFIYNPYLLTGDIYGN